MENYTYISNSTQKLMMEFFLKYSIPKILKDNET